MNLKLVLEYDGLGFFGWQLQPGRRRTVQGTLADALQVLPGAWGPLHGAGRTDAGAHAEGQVVSVTYTGPVPLPRLGDAINAHLPADVAIVSVTEVPPAFHARFSAVSRRYRYRFVDRPARPVVDRGHCWWIRRPLDDAAITEALPHLLGRHDWTSLCAASVDPERRERDLFTAGLFRCGERLELEITGEGFLRGLVRGIAGAVAQVGLGRREPEWLGELIAARDRSRAPQAAPAHGLTLVEVTYAESGSAPRRLLTGDGA